MYRSFRREEWRRLSEKYTLGDDDDGNDSLSVTRIGLLLLLLLSFAVAFHCKCFGAAVGIFCVGEKVFQWKYFTVLCRLVETCQER